MPLGRLACAALHVAVEMLRFATGLGLTDGTAVLAYALGSRQTDVLPLLHGYPQGIERSTNLRAVASVDNLTGSAKARLPGVRLPEMTIST